MDITTFVHNQRQEALLLGDYNAYRGMCSRRLATLRKRLGRATSGKKYSPPTPITPENLAQDPSHAQLLLYSSERAWAHGMHLKSLVSEDPASVSGDVRSHVVSRLHKSRKHAFELCTLLSSEESKAMDKDLLEATAYASSLWGAEAFEQSHWEEALRAFATARMIYSTLFTSTKSDTYKEQLSGTVDPSVRYSAYQLQLERSMDIASISRQYFPQDQYPKIAEALQRIDPEIFVEPIDKETVGAAAVTSVTWRGRVAPVEEADISIALSDAQTAENAYTSHDQHGSTDAFDAVLSAWQDAVDATRKAIDEHQSEGMSMGEQKMQNLQLTWTVVNYSMICWRVGRNRVMIDNIMTTSKKPKIEGGDEVRGKKLGHLKEEVVLYDAILQSLEQILNLPGVAADEPFTAELSAKTSFFSALRTSSIARSHALLSNRQNALALYHRAHSYIASALPHIPSGPSEPSHKGLEVTSEDAKNLEVLLQGKMTQFRALVEMDTLATKAGNVRQQHGVLLERLDQWPDKVDFQAGIVHWPPKVVPVPVKPLFLDIAWNFIEYPGRAAARAQETATQKQEQQQEAERKGLLGRLWGR